MSKQRRIPLRKCIVTKEMKPKSELIRIVRNKAGDVFVDPTGKENGRGAYITKQLKVVEKAIQTKALNEQLRTNIDETIYEEIKEMIEG